MFSVCSKPFKNIIVAVGSNRSVEYIGHGVWIITKLFLHKLEDHALIAMIEMHQVVVILDVGKMFHMPTEELKF